MVLVPGVGDAYDQPAFPSRKWNLKPSRYGTMCWQRENDMLAGDEAEELPMKLEPLIFTEESYQQNALVNGWQWTFEESVRLAELAWRFDCRFPIVQNYFPDQTSEQVMTHYERLERAFTPNNSSFKNQEKPMFTDDAWIKHLRKNLDEIISERELIIKTFAAPLYYQTTPSLPDLLQKNLGGRRRKSESTAPSTQLHKQSASQKKPSASDTPKNVVRGVQAVNAKPLQKEVLVASEMHWKGIKPSVIKQVEKRMLELGIPLRPIVPSDRICTLYRNLVIRLSNEIEKTKRRN